jgi:hypothetical protein
MKRHVKIAALVFVAPLIGWVAISWRDHFHYDYPVANYAFLAAAGIFWWPFATFASPRVFLGGLIGVEASMIAFSFWSARIRLDALGWVFLPFVELVGLVLGILASFIRLRANQSTDPTLASGTPGAGHQSRHP